MKWDNYGFVVASRVRKEILNALEIQPYLPSELTKKLSLDKSQVTRSLHELEKIKLIKCLTPNNRKGKVYTITQEGKIILEKIKL
ncbi:MAG TPA: ArsR family transcriptional regulator [Candidatus Aenigmarchaeota archaeon]|nr:ArsR family transcriptional regulator [Candidatus Aenigmarchaeota archaeon]